MDLGRKLLPYAVVAASLLVSGEARGTYSEVTDRSAPKGYVLVRDEIGPEEINNERNVDYLHFPFGPERLQDMSDYELMIIIRKEYDAGFSDGSKVAKESIDWMDALGGFFVGIGFFGIISFPFLIRSPS